MRADPVPEILAVVGELTGLGFVTISRVVDGRRVIHALYDTNDSGLKAGDDLPDSLIAIESRRSQFTSPPSTDGISAVLNQVGIEQGEGGFGYFVSHAIVGSDGSTLGTLCASDRTPCELELEKLRGLFTRLTALLSIILQQARELVESEAELASQYEAALSREQFIAVVGHDLRNPLAAIQSGIRLLEKHGAGSPERSRLILAQMQRSASRMNSLISDVLDLASSRLGDGMSVKREPVFIGPIMDLVVAELASTNPERIISAACLCGHSVSCDPDRFAQLLSNLLGNALVHGAMDQPVRVLCESDGVTLNLSVINGGAKISDESMALLFHPFVRGEAAAGRNGLGLGLYIATQIALAHGGTLTASSTDVETCFVFQMPLSEP